MDCNASIMFQALGRDPVNWLLLKSRSVSDDNDDHVDGNDPFNELLDIRTWSRFVSVLHSLGRVPVS